MPEVLEEAPAQCIALERTLSASRLNAVANHPEVRPWLGGTGELDLTELVENPTNISFQTKGGGFIAVCLDIGLYEVHSLFLPTARREAIPASIAGLDYMFTRTDCIELVTRLPEGNKAAEGLARLGGFTKRFRREGVWDGKAVDFASITVQEWALSSPVCMDAGRAFHDELERQKAARSSVAPNHPDDPVHDAMAGAAALMIDRGNIFKGANVYNRWALVAGYVPISVMSANPPVIDIGDAIVEVRDGTMETIQCR